MSIIKHTGYTYLVDVRQTRGRVPERPGGVVLGVVVERLVHQLGSPRGLGRCKGAAGVFVGVDLEHQPAMLASDAFGVLVLRHAQATVPRFRRVRIGASIEYGIELG